MYTVLSFTYLKCKKSVTSKHIYIDRNYNNCNKIPYNKIT